MFIGILQENLLPFIDALVADGFVSPVFQQDNAISHVSNRNKNWFEVATEEHSFPLMEWPPNSPGLNPSEHLCAHLKAELH